jgi:hypothetical protein
MPRPLLFAGRPGVRKPIYIACLETYGALVDHADSSGTDRDDREIFSHYEAPGNRTQMIVGGARGATSRERLGCCVGAAEAAVSKGASLG